MTQMPVFPEGSARDRLAEWSRQVLAKCEAQGLDRWGRYACVIDSITESGGFRRDVYYPSVKGKLVDFIEFESEDLE